jgi:hypothetical protein
MKKKHSLHELKISSFVTELRGAPAVRTGADARETKPILVCTTTFGHTVQITVCDCSETSPLVCP